MMKRGGRPVKPRRRPAPSGITGRVSAAVSQDAEPEAKQAHEQRTHGIVAPVKQLEPNVQKCQDGATGLISDAGS